MNDFIEFTRETYSLKRFLWGAFIFIASFGSGLWIGVNGNNWLTIVLCFLVGVCLAQASQRESR